MQHFFAPLQFRILRGELVLPFCRVSLDIAPFPDFPPLKPTFLSYFFKEVILMQAEVLPPPAEDFRGEVRSLFVLEYRDARDLHVRCRFIQMHDRIDYAGLVTGTVFPGMEVQTVAKVVHPLGG